MSDVIEPTGFIIGAHPRGPVLSIMAGPTVAANIRLDPSLVWKLVHELPRALKEQAAMEEVVARRKGYQEHGNEQS
jgi:hypothetical protein